MKVINKDGIISWKGLEEIKELDLNAVKTYECEGKVIVKNELTPLAYVLLSNYCKRGSVKLINDGKEFVLLDYHIEETGVLKLVCEKDNKNFEINCEVDMKIRLNCTNVILKMMILQVQADMSLDDSQVNYASRLIKIAQQNKNIMGCMELF